MPKVGFYSVFARLISAVMLLLVFALAGADDYAPNEIVVKFKPGAGAYAQQANAAMGAWMERRIEALQSNKLRLPRQMSVEYAVRFYRSLPFVEYAEPNYVAEATLTPNDSNFPSQWNLNKIACPAAWDISSGLGTVKIAIIDTGIDLTHPDLFGKVVGGYDFVNDDADAQDDHGHGTHCAGIAAAATNNGIGIAGVGFNCSLMPVKVLDAAGSGTYSDVAAGIVWATDNGAKVISLSLGGSASSTVLSNAIDYAWSHGAIVVAAAGNNGTTSAVFPAYYSKCIAVASTDANDQRSYFSTYGSWVDVAAPGSGILSTYLGGGYATMSGTSMATPHVAGEAGLLWSVMGNAASNTSVRGMIEQNTDPVGSFVAKGRINVSKALAAGLPPARNDFFADSLTMLLGSVADGDYSYTTNSDDLWLELASEPGVRRQTMDWYASTHVSFPGTLRSLEVEVEAAFDLYGDTKIYLYNFLNSRWEQIASMRLFPTDATRVFVRASGSSKYIAPDGEVRVRFYRLRYGTPEFRMRVDRLRITTVSK